MIRISKTFFKGGKTIDIGHQGNRGKDLVLNLQISTSATPTMEIVPKRAQIPMEAIPVPVALVIWGTKHVLVSMELRII